MIYIVYALLYFSLIVFTYFYMKCIWFKAQKSSRYKIYWTDEARSLCIFTSIFTVLSIVIISVCYFVKIAYDHQSAKW